MQAEAYPRIARQFKIWPFPRGHHQHLVALPYKGSTWLLADVRFCPLLPPELRVLPSPSLRDIAAPLNTSCTDACRWAGPRAGSPRLQVFPHGRAGSNMASQHAQDLVSSPMASMESFLREAQ